MRKGRLESIRPGMPGSPFVSFLYPFCFLFVFPGVSYSLCGRPSFLVNDEVTLTLTHTPTHTSLFPTPTHSHPLSPTSHTLSHTPPTHTLTYPQRPPTHTHTPTHRLPRLPGGGRRAAFCARPMSGRCVASLDALSLLLCVSSSSVFSALLSHSPFFAHK